MKDKVLWFKIIFTFTFLELSIFVVVSDWAKEHIDNKSIILLLIAFLPWLIKYIKTLEIFGLKAELISEKKMQEVDKIMEPITNKEIDIIMNECEDKGIKEKDNNIIHCDIISSVLNAEDPISKLVLGRYELEKIIRKLIEKNKLSMATSINQMVRDLYHKNHISNKEYELITELLPILNKAVHSDMKNVDEEQIKWIVNKIIRILEHLDYRYKTGKDFSDWLKI